MAELTIEPAETVRVRVERALAREVNLASEAAAADGGADRGDAPLYDAEALSGQAPRLSARTAPRSPQSYETSLSA